MTDTLVSTSIIFGLACAFAYGIQDVVVKAKIKTKEPRPIIFFWMLAGLPLAIAAALLFDKNLPYAWFSNYTYAVSIFGAICGAVAYDHYYRGVTSCRVSVMASLNTLNSAILTIACIAFYKETVTPQIILAFALAFIGTALSVLSEHRSAKKENRGFPELHYLAYSITGFAASSFAGIYVLKQVGAFWEFAIDRSVFLVMLGLFYVPILKKSLPNLKAYKGMIGSILLISVLGVTGVLTSNIGIANGLPALVIPLSSSGAAFTTLFGIFAFKEKLSWQQKVGLLMVAGAVVVAAI